MISDLARTALAEPHSLNIVEDDRAEWFEHFPSAIIICNNSGIVVASNHAANDLLRQGLLHLDAHGRLQVPTGHAKRDFGDPIRQAGRLRCPVRCLAPLATGTWLALSIIPFAGARGDRLCLHLREIVHGKSIDLAAVAREFGITDSELPVLQGVAEATCPKEISRMLGLSVHTIRSHLRTIYAKLGVRSLAEAQNKVLNLYYNLQIA